MLEREIHIGIAFATGRKSFQNVLNAYIYHLQESMLLKDRNVHLHLLVAYDLAYAGTVLSDYTSVRPGVLEQFTTVTFLGEDDIDRTAQSLVQSGVIEAKEADLCFGNGYASKRNILLYTALKKGLDYLIFLDDDEYPMAVTESKNSTLWSGQHVLEAHLKYLRTSDMTNGYHCGYISPIPYMEFDNVMTAQDFQIFIEALSNDILNWDEIKKVIDNGGITYANKEVLIEQAASLVPEVNGAKFITGGNLGINLTDPAKVFAFYNPPGARGEDTFLSTCLHEINVKRIPAYTFHDGFSIYSCLLQGVLPTRLKRIGSVDSEEIIRRFYNACIGWVRYKPLYTFLTRPKEYVQIMKDMKEKLKATLPKISAYFNVSEFANIESEFIRYESRVQEHLSQFIKTKEIWERVKQSIDLASKEST